MRTSILSRSVIAIATLAVGSVALAATPATAATSTGITRAVVLKAAADIRADLGNTSTALNTLTAKACGASATDEVDYFGYDATPAGAAADGLYLTAVVSSGGSGQFCTFAAFAATAPSTQLGGTATVTSTADIPGQTPVTGTLSGDVFVMDASSVFPFGPIAASAKGNAVTSVSTTTSTPKTTKQKTSAKKAYAKKLKAAKKSYRKALAKAGSSKAKKKAAKAKYAHKKASAKKTYKKAIAPAKRTTVKKTTTPFDVTTAQPTPIM